MEDIEIEHLTIDDVKKIREEEGDDAAEQLLKRWHDYLNERRGKEKAEAEADAKKSYYAKRNKRNNNT